jgi:hypothetical protein
VCVLYSAYMWLVDAALIYQIIAGCVVLVIVVVCLLPPANEFSDWEIAIHEEEMHGPPQEVKQALLYDDIRYGRL